VSPFRTPRRVARALAARALAGVGVFGALAVALIAATGGEPLAIAQSTDTTAPPAAAAPDPASVVPAPQVPEQAVPPEPVETPPPATEQPAEPAAAEPVNQPAEALQAAPVEQGTEVVEDAAEAPAEAPAAERRAPVSQQDASGAERRSGPPDGRAQLGDERGLEDERGLGDERGSSEDRDRGSAGDRGWAGGEEAASGDESQGVQAVPPGEDDWRGIERRTANLTGAIGTAGGGGKDAGRLGGSPGLSSPLPLPAVIELEPLSGDSPSEDSATPPPPAPPAASGPAPRDNPPRSVRVGSPRENAGTELSSLSGTGGTGGGGGATGIDTGTGTTTTDGGATTIAEDAVLPAPAADADFVDPVGQSEAGGDGSANPLDQIKRGGEDNEELSIIRPVEDVVNRVPDSLKFALAALGVLSLLLGLGYLLTARRARSLARQRTDLLQEVGLLQSALLPPVPERLGTLRTSVAYRPADGPGAGGDFYDVLPLTGGAVGFILGDVSGHGRGALARTAFMRYTLRAYLEAGLEPRAALQVAGRVIDENLGGDFATVLLAVHDPETGSLTYATAGHPAPIVVGPQPHHPVTAGSSPPIGVGVPTGLRQTTVPLVSGSVACLFTDGLMDARADGGILGRDRLEQMLRDLGDDASARELIERVSREARVLSDDIAAVVVSPADGVVVSAVHTEQLELSARELDGPIGHRFLEACGVAKAAAGSAVEEARTLAAVAGGAVLHVVCAERPSVEVLPRNAAGLETASHRTTAR
jgi:Stage II sporulation protein E (SpoIIE)